MKVVNKTGWWKVSFDNKLEGEDVRFEDLSEATQDHIIDCIKEGYTQGEIVEEYEVDDEDDDCSDDEIPNPCDYCGVNSEVVCNGCLK